jgi:hypothetical protein
MLDEHDVRETCICPSRPPFVKGRDVFHALWLKRECPAGDGVDAVVTPSMVLEAVR